LRIGERAEILAATQESGFVILVQPS
jgi:hypothetical protein